MPLAAAIGVILKASGKFSPFAIITFVASVQPFLTIDKFVSYLSTPYIA
jgi:hypothetical protein